MSQLTVNQFNLLTNTFSLSIGALGIATAFVFLQRRNVVPRHRHFVTILAS